MIKPFSIRITIRIMTTTKATLMARATATEIYVSVADICGILLFASTHKFCRGGRKLKKISGVTGTVTIDLCISGGAGAFDAGGEGKKAGGALRQRHRCDREGPHERMYTLMLHCFAEIGCNNAGNTL